MIKIGITGNIASGKSLVESLLQEEGIATIDSDKIVHDLLNNDKETINQVYNLFIKDGIDVKDEKGHISRPKVAEIVFKNKEKRKKLEAIIHPRVKEKIEGFFRNNQDKKIIAVIVPLLFEAKMEKMFDYTVLITVSKDMQIDRLVNKRGFSKEEALNRINAQMSQKEKISKSSYVIDNNSSIEDLKNKLKQVLTNF